MRIVAKKYVCLALMFSLPLLVAGCYGVTVKKPAELTVSKVSQDAVQIPSSNKKLSIGVPTTNPYVVPGLSIGPHLSQDPANAISELSVIEFRRILQKNRNFKIFTAKKLPAVDYTIKVRCTEFANDLTTDQEKSKEGTLPAASLIAVIGPQLTSASAFLGPLGGLVAGFNTFTGLSFAQAEDQRKGVLAIDVQLINSSGVVEFSKPYRASFVARKIRSGGHTMFASSTAQDAVRTAVEAALRDMLPLL